MFGGTDIQPDDSAVEPLNVDAQETSGRSLVEVHLLEGLGDGAAFDVLQAEIFGRIHSASGLKPGREVGDGDLIAGGDDMGVFHDVGEFANVARPAVFLEETDGLGGELF